MNPGTEVLNTDVSQVEQAWTVTAGVGSGDAVLDVCLAVSIYIVRGIGPAPGACLPLRRSSGARRSATQTRTHSRADSAWRCGRWTGSSPRTSRWTSSSLCVGCQRMCISSCRMLASLTGLSVGAEFHNVDHDDDLDTNPFAAIFRGRRVRWNQRVGRWRC